MARITCNNISGHFINQAQPLITYGTTPTSKFP